MKLAISNIAWPAEKDRAIYKQMQLMGVRGLEIAPTRIFSENPYSKLKEIRDYSLFLHENYEISICSMQSILYGRTENIFGTEQERRILTDYTKRAIDFAVAGGCLNLVFGCPKNRNRPVGADKTIAVDFFGELAQYAEKSGTIIGMEANPTIYNTNFINDTPSAIRLIQEVGSKGFQLNLDVGTMIYNGESLKELKGHVHEVNHIHISEPQLKMIQKRDLHYELSCLLQKESYSGYVSVEMGKAENEQTVIDAMQYLKMRFG